MKICSGAGHGSRFPLQTSLTMGMGHSSPPLGASTLNSLNREFLATPLRECVSVSVSIQRIVDRE